MLEISLCSECSSIRWCWKVYWWCHISFTRYFFCFSSFSEFITIPNLLHQVRPPFQGLVLLIICKFRPKLNMGLFILSKIIFPSRHRVQCTILSHLWRKECRHWLATFSLSLLDLNRVFFLFPHSAPYKPDFLFQASHPRIWESLWNHAHNNSFSLLSK